MRHVRFTAAMASLLTTAAFVAYPAVSSASPASDTEPAAADQPGPPGLPHRHRDPAGPGRAHHVPVGH